MKEIEVKVTIRNNLIKERRLSEGLTQKELADRVGLNKCTISAIEGFRKIGRIATHKLSNYFGCEPNELYPEYANRIKTAEVVFTTDYNELLIERADVKLLDHKIDTRDFITKVLKELTPREEEVLRMRFFEEKTLDEIGKIFGVHRERIRQIEAGALRTLRRTVKKYGLTNV